MSTNQRIVYLVRHGATDDFEAARLQGQQRNGGLSARGIQQVQRLAHALSIGEHDLQHDTTIESVYSSDLQRAVETSTILAKSAAIPIFADTRLREIAFGEWEGLTLGEIHAQYPDEQLTAYSVPHAVARYGGEAMSELQERVTMLWQELITARSTKAVLIVSHAQALSTLLCVALQLPIGATWRFGIDPASITTLRIFADSASTTFLYRLNQTFTP